MELSEKACEEILKQSLETFDVVDKEEGGIKDWRSIFEAAFQCLLTLKNTEALQLFATMCICALDFDTYSSLEEVFMNREKTIPMMNTLTYQELNDKNSSE